jgi:hypothetical protein
MELRSLASAPRIDMTENVDDHSAPQIEIDMTENGIFLSKNVHSQLGVGEVALIKV